MKKVAVWGTFDGVHQGHIEFLQQAKGLGDKLYVVVITDRAGKENRGIFPTKTSEERKEELLRLGFIDDVFVDSLTDGLNSILELKPDIFAFGPDQTTYYEKQLQKYLSSKGLNPQYIYLNACKQKGQWLSFGRIMESDKMPDNPKLK